MNMENQHKRKIRAICQYYDMVAPVENRRLKWTSHMFQRIRDPYKQCGIGDAKGNKTTMNTKYR